MNIPKKTFPIDLGDGVQRELWFSAASAQRLAKKHGSFLAAVTSEFASIIGELIYEGLTDKADVTADSLSEAIPLSRVGDLKPIVVGAMYGMTEAEYKAKEKQSIEEAADVCPHCKGHGRIPKNEAGQPQTIQ
jgi:hypothetical protein